MSKHIVRAQQFSRERLERNFKIANRLRAAFEHPASNWNRETVRGLLKGKLLNYMFWQESTRTRLSFCNGAAHLGIEREGSDNAKFSSVSKGESLIHTVRVICGYEPDLLIMRHDEEGAAEVASGVADKYGFNTCIVNAGDGSGQHPTQAILDSYAINRERGAIDGAHIVIGGDLHYGRTVRSLAYLLERYRGIRISFVSPPELKLRPDITAYLDHHGVKYEERDEIDDLLPEADLFYWTRIQTNLMKDEDLKRRMKEVQATKFQLDMSRVSRMRRDAVILHPMPIDSTVNEITPEVDDDPRCAMFRQARGGMFSRMALICEQMGVNIL